MHTPFIYGAKMVDSETDSVLDIFDARLIYATRWIATCARFRPLHNVINGSRANNEKKIPSYDKMNEQINTHKSNNLIAKILGFLTEETIEIRLNVKILLKINA